MSQTGDPIRVLHVDDEPDLCEMVATFLEREDDRISVFTAQSVTTAREILGEHDIDCIVSDYDMPESNGIEFLQRIRDEYPDLPFILYTGKGSEEVASDAISAGVTDYLQKERGTDQYTVLANRITHAVDHYRSQQIAERSKKRLRDVIDTLPHLLYVVDENGVYQLANQALAEFHETTVDEIEGSRLDEVLGDREAKRFREKVEEVFDAPTTTRFDPIELTDPSGDTHVFEPRLRPYDFGETETPAVLGIAADITERMDRERELRRKERRYQAVFNDPNILVGLVDTDGTVVDINRTAMEYVDVSLDQLVGIPFWDTPWFSHSPSLQAEVKDWIDRAKDGEYVEFEADLQRPDGDPYTIEGVFRPVRNDDGDVVSLLISDRDITERKQRERELKRYEAYLKESSDIVTVLDESGTITYQGPAVERVLGYEPQELVGENGFDFIHPEDVDEVTSTFADLVAQPDATVTIQCRFRTAEDTWRWLEVHGSNQLDNDAINGIVTNNRDITDRKEHERELEQTNVLLSTLIETLPVGILAEDEDRNILIANDRLLELFDLSGSPAEVVGDDCKALAEEVSDMFSEPDRFLDRIDEVIQDRESVRDEELALTDGRVFARSHAPIELSDGDGQLWVYRDITDRKEREDQLEQHNERLEQFASVVSHDLRNPLNVAEGRLELAKGECESAHLDDIERAHGRMDTLIDNLLTVAKADETAPDPSTVQLASVVDGCWSNVETGTASLVLETDRDIEADESRFKQLLENLIRNAIEHGGADVTVTVGEVDDGFYLEDDGSGIPPAERDRVFDVGHSSTADGTGFGLSIVKQVVDAHDWQIRVTESSEGGARFEVTGVTFARG